MKYDFNVLEQSAWKLVELGRHAEAIKIYLFMADGDPSLDAGWLGWRLGVCYEALGDLNAASYWHGRALEECPEVDRGSVAARARLLPLVGIDELLIVKTPKLPRDFAAEVGDILLRHWDPIGVRDEAAAQHEYAAYVGGIVGLIFSGATQETVAEHLLAIERERMGLPGNVPVAAEAAALLVALRT